MFGLLQGRNTYISCEVTLQIFELGVRVGEGLYNIKKLY